LQARATTTENERITARFVEEFGRYMAPETTRPGAGPSIRPEEPRSFSADRPSAG
jgi:hypothetical protein